MMPVKRFIAGVVCPRCGEMDKIRAWQEAGQQHRECVACDFTDQLDLQAPVNELPTRVNQTQADPADEIQVVRLITKP